MQAWCSEWFICSINWNTCQLWKSCFEQKIILLRCGNTRLCFLNKMLCPKCNPHYIKLRNLSVSMPFYSPYYLKLYKLTSEMGHTGSSSVWHSCHLGWWTYHPGKFRSVNTLMPICIRYAQGFSGPIAHEVKERAEIGGKCFQVVLTPLKGETEGRIEWKVHSTEKVSDRLKESPSIRRVQNWRAMTPL